MTMFSEELEHEGSRIIFLVSDFSESNNKWDKVSYENCGELHVFVVVPYLKPRGYFVDIFCASYGAIMLHIFQNLIYYKGEDCVMPRPRGYGTLW